MAWKSHITRYIGRLAELVHNETGKPLADAQLEILLAIVHIDWAARHARKVLRPRRVRSGLVAINQAATLEYQPLGVVGVIGPWNYPVFTPMGSIAYALAAGNAVVFKPSELTPAVGGWLVSSFAEVVPEQPVLQLLTGGGRHRRAPGPQRGQQDRLHRLGRHRQEGDGRLRPEPHAHGGRVRWQGRASSSASDADLDAAADAAAWGALSNAGQTCIGIERVYVAEDVLPHVPGEADRTRCRGSVPARTARRTTGR